MKKGGDRQQISKIVKKMSDGNQYEEVQNPHNKIKINNDKKDSYDRMVRRHVGGDNIKLSLIEETNLATQREQLIQVKENVSSKILRLGRVWSFLEPKGKYE